MNSSRIALMNFRNNLKTYSMHMAVVIFSVAIYYNFAVLRHNPELLKVAAISDSANGASQAASFLLLIFIAFFIWFADSFLLRQRKKEIAIYAFMGIENSRIGRIFAMEIMIQGIVALVAGLLLGILTGKLFMMLLAKAALLNVSIDFFFSWGSIIETVVVSAVIFMLSSLRGWWDISRSQLISLINASRIEEGIAARVSYFKGAASVLMIAAAYYLCVTFDGSSLNNIIVFLVILVVIGSFWLFGSFLPMVINKLMSNKSFLYKGVRTVSFSNLAFRLRTNYRTMAAIAVLVAASITALGTVSSMQYYVNETYDIKFPYSFTYLNQVDDPAVQAKVNSMINKSEHKILLEEKAQLLYTEKAVSSNQSTDKEMILMNYEDFARITNALQVDGYKQLAQKLKPARGETLYVEAPGVMISLAALVGSTIHLGNMDLKIKEKVKVPLLGAGVPAHCLVVNAADYAALQHSLKTYYFYGLQVDRQKTTWDLAMDLKSISPLNNSLYSYVEVFEMQYNEIGVVYFVGAFLALVFLLATGSIMFFKLISDAMADREKYLILSRVGMTQKEMSRAVFWQVGISFALPLVIGAIHSLAALFVLYKLMNFSLVIPTATSIGIFSLIYAIFALLTTRKFLAVVSS